jgi:gliding motility-associated-like protein
MFIPDAFSPNGDGLNDNFKPSTIGLKEYNFEIYDRWGEQIFETNGSADSWDGSFKGNKSPQGVYVYLLKVLDVKGRSHTYNGKVVLIR